MPVLRGLDPDLAYALRRRVDVRFAALASHA